MLILERWESDWAVLEADGKIFRLPAELMPSDAKEGVALTIQITIDHQASEERSETIKNLFDQLF